MSVLNFQEGNFNPFLSCPPCIIFTKLICIFLYCMYPICFLRYSMYFQALMSNGPKWTLSSNLNKKQCNLYRCPSRAIRLEFPGLPPVAHRSLSSYQITAVSTQIYSPASLSRGSWSVFVLLHYSRLGAAIRLHLLLLSRLTNFGFPQTRSQNIKKWNYWKVVKCFHGLLCWFATLSVGPFLSLMNHCVF